MNPRDINPGVVGSLRNKVEGWLDIDAKFAATFASGEVLVGMRVYCGVDAQRHIRVQPFGLGDVAQHAQLLGAFDVEPTDTGIECLI